MVLARSVPIHGPLIVASVQQPLQTCSIPPLQQGEGYLSLGDIPPLHPLYISPQLEVLESWGLAGRSTGDPRRHGERQRVRSSIWCGWSGGVRAYSVVRTPRYVAGATIVSWFPC